MPGTIPPPTVINNENRDYGVVVGLVILGAVSTFFTLLRLWYRARLRAIGPDDYAIIPALVLYLGWTVMAVYVYINAGVGKPLWEITLGEFSTWFKGVMASAFLYPAMSASIRVSIILLYVRVFGKSNIVLRYAIWALLVLQGVYVVVYSILPAFIGKPLHKVFDPIERPKHMNDWYYYYSQVALYSTSMAFDIILLFFPIYPVLQLQMNARSRIGVLAMFMLGAGASIAAAYKLAIFVTQMQRYTNINPIWLDYQMSLLIPPQFDEYGTTFWIPSQVEPSVALIGAALPALRPLIQGTVQRIKPVLSSIPGLGSRSDGKSTNASSRSATRTPDGSLIKSKDASRNYIELRDVNSTHAY
ncbi:hypothetical protein M011DRAFT_195601 [Sporormia fimetaria CBS 119925]|uniref:Rhodopsin domain-containing protein n=1 Tax=Sporormia fimetaria CBS 119925 TaxID=1340428 RepID=A0A6A6V2N6_9PLEO|nr:hypothetical protein M011DRAFT_195601 [Sporormia fimetaria CBS 119925]